MPECLSRLLCPLDTDSFLEHYRERRYFHVGRSQSEYYSDILGMDEIDTVLQSRQLPAASLNVVKEGVRCPIEEWSVFQTTSRGAQQVAIPEKLLDLYAGGATLILNQAQESLPGLNHTCRILTEEFGFPTQTNIYITPRNSTGFSKHSDEHDVLVLQITGSKSWLVYPTGDAPVEIDLRSGDLLYIPRGMFHAARAHEEDSIHITLGLVPLYAFQLIRELATVAEQMGGFASPMPPRFAGAEAMRSFEADFRSGLQTMIAGMKPSALADRCRANLVSDQTQGWPGRLGDLRLLHRITSNTVVCRRPGILTLVKEAGKFLHVEFSDRQIAIPVFMRDELPRVLDERQFAVREVGGMTTDSTKIAFISEFVKAGLLRIINI